jgi:hypothetical protein
VSQIPALPLAVPNVRAEADAVAELDAAADVVVVVVAVIVVVAVVVVAVVVVAVVVVAPAADVEPPPQATASIATAASGRPKPNVRIEVLANMMFLPRRGGPGTDPLITGAWSIRAARPKGLDCGLRRRSHRPLPTGYAP